MEQDQHIWQVWARNLHRWGVSDWAVTFLEISGPLTILGAQLIYLGQPWLSGIVPKDKSASLARLLENSSSKREFIDLLQEATKL
ncbi:MAG: hypothetical protein B6D39_12725 [Anaerolineae bacterium UTCFX2]|jgi:hypothetical protein|nr:hypothetical protein [Anaerolineales bacterium]OQY87609.1 MAG: hypothetical protein B6D39_12725 [Anaerolineae bacterium UTCFX2]